jgi:hypothetical protein
MVFDAHDRAFALFKGACGRGIFHCRHPVPLRYRPRLLSCGWGTAPGSTILERSVRRETIKAGSGSRQCGAWLANVRKCWAIQDDHSAREKLSQKGLAAEMGFELPVRFRVPTRVISIAYDRGILLISECWRCCS